MANSKNYTYKVSGVKINAQGTQSQGQGAGMPYAIGTFQASVKNSKTGEQMTVTKGFKAFDTVTKKNSKTLTPASDILKLVEEGKTEMVLAGQFRQGRARDEADASKGKYSDFDVRFVETMEAHAEFVESRKAARAAQAETAEETA